MAIPVLGPGCICRTDTLSPRLLATQTCLQEPEGRRLDQ